MSELESIYNIGVVSRMTGIPPATLRIWERRYGFPSAERTEGGHRLYSDREVQRLRWIKARVDDGMQIRQAVRALEMMDQAANLASEAPGQAQIAGASKSGTAGPISAPDAQRETYLTVLQQRLYDTVIELSTAESDRLLDEGMALYSPEDLILHVIGPTLAAIGLSWERGVIGIGTEHAASAYLRRWLAMWRHSGPPLYDVAPTVLACAPGETHEGSLMMVAALLRRRRWPVTYVGQSIPLPDLASFVRATHPLAVVMVAMTEGPAQALSEWPLHMPEAAQTGHPVVGYGGRIFTLHPEWRSRVPGLFLGPTVEEGVEMLERVLQNQTGRGSLAL